MSVSGHTERTRQSAELQLDEDPRFQERMWRIERLGWWAIGGILVAAAAGLFGHGLASRATLAIPDPARPASHLTLEYDRFTRAHSESQFIVIMDAVVRGASVYLLLMLIFRLAGGRTMAQMTSFDFVLLWRRSGWTASPRLSWNTDAPSPTS